MSAPTWMLEYEGRWYCTDTGFRKEVFGDPISETCCGRSLIAVLFYEKREVDTKPMQIGKRYVCVVCERGISV